MARSWALVDVMSLRHAEVNGIGFRVSGFGVGTYPTNQFKRLGLKLTSLLPTQALWLKSGEVSVK